MEQNISSVSISSRVATIATRRGRVIPRPAHQRRLQVGLWPIKTWLGRSVQPLPKAARSHDVKITRPKQTLWDTLTITSLFAVWYLSNIYFNIFNKQVLNAFGHAGTCTWIHLAVSSVLASALWIVRLQPRPPLTPRVIDVIFPLAILHLLGFYTTNASLGAVNVSLTHTIKSMEPFFTVVLSWLLMKARPAKRVIAALVPVVVGVVVASATDLSFTWAGFNAAMMSNLAFQCRNVLSKKAMMRTSYESLEGGGDNDTSSLNEVNIFAVMSIMACIMMVPVVAAIEGPSLAQLGPSPIDWMSADMWRMSILAGICRYVALSYIFLAHR
jgi:solute carrier family 35, member E1